MPLLADSHSFTVAPSAFLVVWTLLALSVLAAAVVTALKGRWGWLAVGWLTVGVVWLYSAFLPALPGSVWARRRAGAPRPPVS